MENIKDKLLDAVYKKALGYTTTESVEEFSVQDGQLVITRQKITTKEVAPDMTAVKLIFDNFKSDSLDQMTDEELKAEKIRLIKLLKELEKTESKKKPKKTLKNDNQKE